MKKFISTAIIVLIISALLLGGCAGEKQSGGLSQLSKAKYIVSFSKEMESPARFVLYDSEGKKIEDIRLPEGQAINNSTEAEGGYFFVSKRKNHHYFIENNGNIKDIYFLKDKYGADERFGTLFVSCSNGWILSAMNIGNFGTGYKNELVYTNDIDGEIKAIETNDGLINSAVVYDNKIYGHCFKTDANKKSYSSIVVYDMQKAQKTDEILIQNHSLADSAWRPMKLFGSDLLLYGDSLAYNEDKRPPCLGSINTKTKEIKEINLDEDFVPASLEIYKDSLYLISMGGEVMILDKNYKQTGSLRLGDDALSLYADKSPYIYKTKLIGSDLYVIYRFLYNKKNIQFPAAVHVYDINTGKLKKAVKITLDGEKQWWAEQLEIEIAQ